MCVGTCVHLFVWNVCVCTQCLCTHVHVFVWYVCVCVHMCMCSCVCMCVCVCVCVRVYARVHGREAEVICFLISNIFLIDFSSRRGCLPPFKHA